MTRAIDIPQAHPASLSQHASLQSHLDDIFTPVDSLSSSLSSTPDDLANSFAEKLTTDDEPSKDLPDANEAHAIDEPVTFGHGPDAWLYLPKTQLFDLSRASPSTVTLPANLTLRHHRGCIIDPARTVLVIVDMQNYFIHPACNPHAGGLAAVPPLLKAIAHARTLGIQVAFLNWVIDDADMRAMPPAVQRGWSAARLRSHGIGWHTNLGAELPDGQGRCLWKGAWNAELYWPVRDAARAEDVTFLKNRPSGMWSRECDMHRWLRAADMKTVMFAGVNTDQCVLGTLTDCYSNGYDCLLLKDCTGTASGYMANELCEWNVATNYGFVLESADFCGAERVERCPA